jgi:hypothetical protein
LKLVRLDTPVVAADDFVGQTLIQVQKVEATLFYASFHLVIFTYALTWARHAHSVSNALHPQGSQVRQCGFQEISYLIEIKI